MPPEEVLAVLTALQARGFKFWLDGGWGIDALLGQVTRPRGDVDLVVEMGMMPQVVGALEPLGFSVGEDLAPVRVVLSAPGGRQVDLHPVTFDEQGTGWQLGAAPGGADCPYPAWGFGHGRILDREVPCLSPELQVEHHCGYEPTELDRLDMDRLSRHFGLALPFPY
jgi:lincosamide nucleotidyltransferase A/C/D/E